jgi:hypothetical protein
MFLWALLKAGLDVLLTMCFGDKLTPEEIAERKRRFREPWRPWLQ